MFPDAVALRHFVLCQMHNAPWGGHVGIKKTRKAIERFHTWASLREDVETCVQSFQRVSATSQLTRVLVACCSRCLNLLGSGLAWILTLHCLKQPLAILQLSELVCLFTEMVHLAACKISSAAEAFAKMLRHEVLRMHDTPYELVSDRDGRFTRRFMK